MLDQVLRIKIHIITRLQQRAAKSITLYQQALDMFKYEIHVYYV